LADHPCPRRAAKFDAALQSHLDALIAEWKRDHDNGEGASDHRPRCRALSKRFLRLVEAGWDAEATRRPHGAHTTVVVHVDVAPAGRGTASGSLLTDAERRYLTCDAAVKSGSNVRSTHRRRAYHPHGQPAASPRARTPATHLCGPRLWGHPRTACPPHSALGRRWPHRVGQLVLVCPYHHRAHHRGVITITGPAEGLTVTDSSGRQLSAGSLAAPTQPSPTRRRTVSRANRRTRRLVVVPTLPTTTTTHHQTRGTAASSPV